MIHFKSKIMMSDDKYKIISSIKKNDKIKSLFPDIKVYDEIIVSSIKRSSRNISHRLCLSDNFFIDCYYSDVFVVKDSNNDLIFRKIYELKKTDKMAYYNFNDLIFLPIKSFFSDTRRFKGYDLELLSDKENIILVNGFLKRV